MCVCVCLCALVFSQGGRGNALNGAMRGRVNGVNGVNRSPLSSLNSLANQEPTAAEYATIRKFRKVTIGTVAHPTSRYKLLAWPVGVRSVDYRFRAEISKSHLDFYIS